VVVLLSEAGGTTLNPLLRRMIRTISDRATRVILEAIVSELSDEIRAVRDEALAAIERVESHVATLQTRIDELQDKVDTGVATEADREMLRETRRLLAAMSPHDPTVLPDDEDEDDLDDGFDDEEEDDEIQE
jgi:hypothetical protein